MSAPRTGRPINFRLDPALAAQVEAAARVEGCSLAEWWTRAARQRLEIVDDTIDLLRAAHDAIRSERAKRGLP